MNGITAQTVALVSHAGAFLSGRIADPSVVPANSTLQYVSDVRFSRYASKDAASGTLVAPDGGAWLEFLKSAGVSRVWYIVFRWDRQDMPEHTAAGFANAVPVAVQTDHPGGRYELWYPNWTAEQGAPKPWSIEYRSLAFDRSHVIRTPSLAQVAAQLREALTAARGFAEAHCHPGDAWPQVFARALAVLEAGGPVELTPPDVLPAEGYRVEARRLLAAAGGADVFGGMGSWNDMGWSDAKVQRRYGEVTARLYEAVKLATVTATNSQNEQARR